MLKYVPSLTDIVLEEIPGKIALAVEISSCKGNCIGCHSPFLREDIGDELTGETIDTLIADNFGINCFLFLGEGSDPEALRALARHLRSAHPRLSTALYSGRDRVEDDIFELFDYVKVGPYIPSRGPLNDTNTNQRMYFHREDITSRFWRK